MTIHKNDDYDVLASLLYPSVDASGNVYYGQTKKLLLDEVFDKNDLGFESHIETFRDSDNDNRHYSYFCWKIGPLKGSVSVALPLSDTLKYARYKLNIESIDNKESTKAGSFSTYYNNITCQFDDLIFPDDNVSPDGSHYYDGRNFYICNETDGVYLYVVVALGSQLETFASESESNSDEPVEPDDSGNPYDSHSGDDPGDPYDSHSGDDPGDPYDSHSGDDQDLDHQLSSNMLALKAVDDDVVISFSDPSLYSYSLILSSSPFSTIDLEKDHEYIIPSGETAYIKCTEVINVPAVSNISSYLYNYSSRNHRHFSISGSGKLELYGKLLALEPIVERKNSSSLPLLAPQRYSYFELFGNNNNVINIYNLTFPTISANYCFARMFYNCQNLVCCTSNEEHTSKSLNFTRVIAQGAFASMFEGCSSLVKGVTITCTKDFNAYSFARMYYGCSRLSEASFDVTTSRTSSVNAFDDFLTYAGELASTRTIYTSHGVSDYIWFTEQAVPHGWEAHTISLANSGDNTEFSTSNRQLLSICSVATRSVDLRSASTEERPTYKRDVMITSGANTSETYGRGDVSNESTVGNMKQISPLNDPSAPKMDTYSNDGSYNQDIWGLKCFNGPVVFRNGIYGETGCLIAKDNTLTIKSYGDSSTIILDADRVQFSGATAIGFGGSGSSQIAGDMSSLKYGSIRVIEATNTSTTTLKSNLVPDVDETRDIGSLFNKINKVYAKSLTGCLPYNTSINIEQNEPLGIGAIQFVILYMTTEESDTSSFCTAMNNAVGKSITFFNHSTNSITVGNDTFLNFTGSMQPITLHCGYEGNGPVLSGNITWSTPIQVSQPSRVGTRKFTLLSQIFISSPANSNITEAWNTAGGYFSVGHTTLSELQTKEATLTAKLEQDTRLLDVQERLKDNFIDPELRKGFDAYLNSRELVDYNDYHKSYDQLIELKNTNNSNMNDIKSHLNLPSSELSGLTDTQVLNKFTEQISSLETSISTIEQDSSVSKYISLTNSNSLSGLNVSANDLITAIDINNIPSGFGRTLR